jgi:hypothetical protein
MFNSSGALNSKGFDRVAAMKKLLMAVFILTAPAANALNYGVIPTVRSDVRWWQDSTTKQDPHWLTRYEGLVGKKPLKFIVRCEDRENHGSMQVVIKTTSNIKSAISLSVERDGIKNVLVGSNRFSLSSFSNTDYHLIPTYNIMIKKASTEAKTQNLRISTLCGNVSTIYTKNHHSFIKLP